MTEAPPELNLRGLVRQVADELDTLDPTLIADAMLDRLDDAQAREALRQTLRAYVRAVWASQRVPISTPRLPAAMAPRTKATRIAAYWQQVLESPVHVGGALWLPFGRCSVEQVAFLIAERRQDASRELARAQQYERVVEEMRRRRAKHVADLPSDVLAEVLEAAA